MAHNKSNEEQKMLLKTVHTAAPTSEEKPKKLSKSALHQKISEFNPSGQMSMQQLSSGSKSSRRSKKTYQEERKSSRTDLEQAARDLRSQNGKPRERTRCTLELLKRIIQPDDLQIQKIQEQNQQIETLYRV